MNPHKLSTLIQVWKPVRNQDDLELTEPAVELHVADGEWLEVEFGDGSSESIKLKDIFKALTIQ